MCCSVGLTDYEKLNNNFNKIYKEKYNFYLKRYL